MSPLLEAWASWTWGVTWQSALLAGAVLVVERLLPDRTWPQVRHGLWCLVAVKLVLPPSLASPFRQAVGAAVGAPAALEPAAPAALLSLQAVAALAFALWLAGASYLGLRAIRRQRRLGAALRREAEPASERCQAAARRVADRLGLERLPRLVTVEDGAVPAPLLVGLVRPTVVLPRSARGWRLADLENVLLHELAHVRRRDLWKELAFAAVATVHWFLPWAHHARRRAREERELLCDATAARLAGGPSYAATLLRLGAPRWSAEPASTPAAGFPARRALLLRRLDALQHDPLDDHGSLACPRRRAALTTAVLVGLALVALPMAAPRAVPRAVSLERVVDLPLPPSPGDTAERRSGPGSSGTADEAPTPARASRIASEPATPAANRDASPAPSRELRDARAALAAVVAHPGAGSLHKRYAALRLHAAAEAAEAAEAADEESGGAPPT